MPSVMMEASTADIFCLFTVMPEVKPSFLNKYSMMLINVRLVVGGRIELFFFDRYF